MPKNYSASKKKPSWPLSKKDKMHFLWVGNLHLKNWTTEWGSKIQALLSPTNLPSLEIKSTQEWWINNILLKFPFVNS